LPWGHILVILTRLKRPEQRLAAGEKEIEGALVKHVTEFLVELGAGFAFVGRQVLLEEGGNESFIDLLFCHLKLRCYVVIELKGGKFKPEYPGQLGFYRRASRPTTPGAFERGERGPNGGLRNVTPFKGESGCSAPRSSA
jgi:hypothetical protein